MDEYVYYYCYTLNSKRSLCCCCVYSWVEIDHIVVNSSTPTHENYTYYLSIASRYRVSCVYYLVLCVHLVLSLFVVFFVFCSICVLLSSISDILAHFAHTDYLNSFLVCVFFSLLLLCHAKVFGIRSRLQRGNISLFFFLCSANYFIVRLMCVCVASKCFIPLWPILDVRRISAFVYCLAFSTDSIVETFIPCLHFSGMLLK